MKLLLSRAEMKLIGVHSMGDRAAELVHVRLMALLTGTGVDLFRDARLNYPTLDDLYRHASFDALTKSMKMQGKGF